MNWQSIYKSGIVSADEAVSSIKSGNLVYVSGNAATPTVLLDALARHADSDQLKDITLAHAVLAGSDRLKQSERDGRIIHKAFFVGSADRDAVNMQLGYIPIHLHRIPVAIKENPPDVALLHTSMPDEYGFLSLGVEVLASKAAAEWSKKVICQVNRRMPRVQGDSFIHVSSVDQFVEADESIITLDSKTFGDVERNIGLTIADLIKDGSTLQLGIGAIPDAVLSSLDGKKDIGIHTEMATEGIVNAVEKGIITGNKKKLHRGKIICTFIMGSKDLYDYVNDNPLFEIHPVDYVNDPFIIAQNPNTVAINSAVSVDLTGQVCSDSIGSYIYSGFGGQLDFIRGATESEGGVPIIAFPSLAKHGTVSRIVPNLLNGSGVVTTRADVCWIVTEYGAVNLFGKTLKERTDELINIAHPKFRDRLKFEARKRH
ncbi:MAG: 4-hydroxybutyrate CoA-transferase [bacterium]|nr:MAG: 4-hydroxybutyrate CoA-transferase [bacterium]